MILVEVVKSLRPQQWIKNFFIFAPLLFSQNILEPQLFLKTLIAFLVFCLLSGALYILNDLKDLEEDKRHPLKSKRPLAAGRLNKSHAVLSFLVLSAVALVLSSVLNMNFLAIALVYFMLQLFYSFWLKHVVILDVFIVAAGFFIRVVAGGYAIEVYMSPWLLICTLLLALFLSMSKRRHELTILEDEASEHRPILKEYSPYLLDQMIAVVTASTVIAYSLYTISEETVTKFGTERLIYTVPFVLYGIFRYLYLVHQRKEGGSPEILVLKDKPLLVAIFLWILTAGLIIYL